jgi:hypothetical protein
LPSHAVIVKNAEVRALLRSVFRVLERLVIGVILALAMFVVVVSMRLMAGPIDLDFLKPQIAREFDTPGGKMRVDAERIHAEWGAIGQPIRIVFTGLDVTDAGGKKVASAPSVALSIDPRGFVAGRILPTAIVVDQATLSADIDRKGGMLRRVMAKTDSTSQGEVVELLIDQLLAEPNSHSLLGQLDTVLVRRAHVSLLDVESGVTWLAPDAQASLKRDASGVIIAAGGRLSRGGDPIDVSLSGVYARDRSHISIEARIDGIKPLMFADFSPDVAILRGIDVALSGRMNVEADGAGDVRTVTMQVTGGTGTLNLPGILPVAHKVHSVNASISVDAASHTAKVDHIDVGVGDVDVSITGTGLRTDQGQSFSGRAEVRRIPIDRLRDYWPLGFADGGRQWALANLSGGTLDVSAAFGLSAPGDDVSKIHIDRNVAFLDYRGMKVHYMPHMPEIEGVSGKARYQDNSLHFDVAGGTCVGLGVTGATIDLDDLDAEPQDQYATIHLPISGPAHAAMAMLSRRPLGLPKDSLFDPKRVSGDVALELTLGFPLVNSLTVEDIDVRAEAALSGFSLKNVMGDVDLTGAVGRVIYANNELTVSGQGKLDGNSVEIGWREMYAAKAPFRQRYEVKGNLPAELVSKAGLPSPEPFLSGLVGATVSYQTQANGSGEVDGKFDLKAAKAAVTPLGWTKDGGVPAQLAVKFKLAAGGKLSSADFDAQGGGLVAKGQAIFNEAAAVQQLSLQQLSVGRSDVTLDWRRGSDGVTLSLKGRSVELDRIRKALRAREEVTAARPGGAAATGERTTKASIQVDQVLLQRGTLGALKGQLVLVGERLASADLALGAGKGMAFKVMPNGPLRSVNLYVPDFGLLLKNAGWLDGLVGGDLNIVGSFDDATAGSPFGGKLRLGPYRMEKVSPRGDVDSLNSTIDGLGRAGDALQQFDVLETRVDKKGDRVDLRDGRTSGKSIGVTFSGWLDLNSEVARLRGVVVPGFVLNNLLSNVPLLGPLLTGGRNGGLFAISYKLEGPFDDLKSDINLMSAVTPGALRELFTAPVDQSPPEKERTTP